jgi:hypothetical protein
MSTTDLSPNNDARSLSPKGGKSHFTVAEHGVWDSIFPSAKISGLRRTRPSPFYMAKIIRSLAELGVCPIFRTTRDGELVPWDSHGTPQPHWFYDPGIQSLLGNKGEFSDPDVNVDAWYHPSDLAAIFGADPSQWYKWPVGMSRSRNLAEHYVSIPVHLTGANLDYLQRRSSLQRTVAKTRLVSTGGVAFFAAASVDLWRTPGDRARIGTLKTKLAVDFTVLRNETPFPSDPLIAELSTPVAATAEPAPVPVPVPVVEAPTRRTISEIEAELKAVEARAVALRQEFELFGAQRIEEGRLQYTAAVSAFQDAVAAATIVAYDIDAPDFDPEWPDCDVSNSLTVKELVLRLPDGRKFVFGRGQRLVSNEEFDRNLNVILGAPMDTKDFTPEG